MLELMLSSVETFPNLPCFLDSGQNQNSDYEYFVNL